MILLLFVLLLTAVSVGFFYYKSKKVETANEQAKVSTKKPKASTKKPKAAGLVDTTPTVEISIQVDELTNRV